MFEFDLQCFADEGSEGAVASDNAPNQAPVATETTTESSEATTNSVPPVAIAKDEMGRRRVVFPQDSQVTAPTESTDPTPNTPVTNETPAESTTQNYTPSELFQEIALGHNVDESRIPQELAGDYAAIRQQQMNVINKQQADAAMQAQPELQLSESEMQAKAQQAQLDAFKEIRKMAEDKAKADLGISDEDIEDAEYSDDDNIQLKVQAYKQAVQMNMNLINQQIANNRAQQQAIELQRQQETQQAMAVIGPKWQEYQKDPHYGEIDAMMEHYYETLPYGEGIKVKASIDRLLSGRPVRGDYEILNNYYLKTKEAYYAKKTGVGITPQPAHRSAPPYVEPTGQNATGDTHKGVDWTRMRTMTPAQRSQFFRDNFR